MFAALSIVSFCNTPAPSMGEFWEKVTDMYIVAAKEAR